MVYMNQISYLGSGGILFFHRSGNAVFHFNAKEQFSSLKFLKVQGSKNRKCLKAQGSKRRRCVQVRGIKLKFEAIAHIPSFISLKDTVTDDDLEVLNITSRCAAFKLEGETRVLFLKEENEDSDPDSLSDPDYNGLDDLCSSSD
ncbi:hypothetical protein RHMOL_Rhmol01G0065000 [Rhododendron molle]|uniref:Uncharacterized protein n=1 Tax=Rhododendron molle TaxID=49168 RepID=A0ACC0PYL4_RHOML|nr:hypothetical protein RHMOL_Rhmol01G0065000 [Rhododendron molle]